MVAENYIISIQLMTQVHERDERDRKEMKKVYITNKSVAIKQKIAMFDARTMQQNAISLKQKVNFPVFMIS